MKARRSHTHRHAARLPSPLGRGPALVFVCLLALSLELAMASAARSQDDGDEAGSPADSTSATTAGGLQGVADQAAATNWQTTAGQGFLGLTNEPKAGVKANVRQYTYYTDWMTKARLARDADVTNTLNWSWEQFRKQDKTIENRKEMLNYGFGRQLPLVATINGSWNWSEDRTTNTAGYDNLYKVDNKMIKFDASRHKFMGMGLLNSVRLGAMANDQASENQNQRNDFRENTAYGGLQSGWALSRGVVVAGRLAGTTTSGNRLLAQQTSPSSAFGDSVGLGVYFNRGIGTGFVQLSRSNFEKKYLEFRRNANGLVDTVGVAEDEKVITELEMRDAVTLDFEHKFRFWRFGGTTKAAHTTDDLEYATGVAGLKQKAQDTADVTLSYATARDSVVAVFVYGRHWDDQRIKDATANRGRQYVEDRDFQVNWYRTLFSATEMNLQYHEGLTQDIAEDQFNENDKDRLQQDFSGRVERAWSGLFRTSMVFSYRQTQDISIRGSSSSNNNVKETYELTPGLSWNLAPWFTVDQNYRVYIQYTDYLYSYLPAVTRKDDYNKRGDVTTKVVIVPNKRLTVTVRHDFNRRFNATKAIEDAAGSAYYNRDLEQDISKINLDLKYTAAPGVSLEASTYRTRDDKTSIGRTITETRTDSGELILGGRFDRGWGVRRQFEVSAMVKKVNAYGPSITASSSDFWEADVWLKWLF